MYNFDLISDIHLDFWIKPSDNKQEIKLDKFIESILPEKTSNTLIIAGDLGHYERQNRLFLEKLSKVYLNILFVSGNHDLYLDSSSIRSRYRNRSSNRVQGIKDMIGEINNVYYLDGDVIEIDGVKYGGVGMWYDFSYGEKVLGIEKKHIHACWWDNMNDSKLIKPTSIEISLNRFEEEKKKLNSILDKSEVIITHVGPDWGNIIPEYKDDIFTSFYYFDGTEFFDRIANKVWCYGHTHRRYDYVSFDCRFLNASLGYPSEGKTNIKKIVNIVSKGT